jgi:chromodomain-helicase-DNA-binding protein 7
VGVGDVICGIGDLEVLGRRLDEICAQIQTALNAPSVLFRLFRPRPDASSSAAAAAADAAWRRGGAVLDLRPEAPPPPPTAAIKDAETATALPTRTLRDYQVAGVGWLIANHAAGRGCILADEMGLGKTAQACRAVAAALMGGAQPNAAALIVAPLSTIEQWRRELNAWTPALEVCIYHDATARGRDLIRHFEWGDCAAPKFDVVVATYETISSDGMLLSRCGADWKCIVIDEAHRLKSGDSRLAAGLEKAVARSTPWRLLVTGTPLQNNLRELWALLHFADRAAFGDPGGFAAFSGVADGDVDRLAALRDMLAPRLLRRVKEDVAKDIPEKKETVVDVELTTLQKRLYRAIYEKSAALLSGVGCGVASLNAVQMSLRNACNHALLVRGLDAHLSNAPDVLVRLPCLEKKNCLNASQSRDVAA